MASPGHEHESEADEVKTETPYAPLDNQDCSALHVARQSMDQWPLPNLPCFDDQRQYTPDPFKPLLEELDWLNEGNLQHVRHAMDILGLFSEYWGRYTEKKNHITRLEKENEVLRASNIHLCQELQALERRHASQEALVLYYGHAFENIRRGIVNVLGNWESYSPSGKY